MAGPWMTGLFFKPVDNVVSPVADGSANPEAVGSCAEVAPVAQRRFGDPDECGYLLERHQLIVGVGGVLGEGNVLRCSLLVLLGSNLLGTTGAGFSLSR